MFALFKKIFLNSSTDDHPETLIKAAIEHAADGTDPWIRAVTTIKRKLWPARLEIKRATGCEEGDLKGPQPPREPGRSEELFMRSLFLLMLIIALSPTVFCSCAVTGVLPGPQAPVKEKRALGIPAVLVGKDWQVIEKAPDLTDERGRLPFQTEQSVQPEGTKPTSPSERQKIETRR